MQGIELNKPIIYKNCSLRFFKDGEHHINRFCKEDVLLMVYDGVLRFSEDGKQYELQAGEYHIQRHHSLQKGEYRSDAPKYLYVHFLGEWNDSDTVLPQSGTFEYKRFKAIIEELDQLAHNNAPYIIKASKFYELLSKLYKTKTENSVAADIADYIKKECNKAVTLQKICEEFHFSKNHIINVFKKEFGVTPITYTNQLRLQKAEYLIEVTSNSLESIAAECGFQNYSHFYKLFHRRNNCSPEEWRYQKRMG